MLDQKKWAINLRWLNSHDSSTLYCFFSHEMCRNFWWFSESCDLKKRNLEMKVIGIDKRCYLPVVFYARNTTKVHQPKHKLQSKNNNEKIPNDIGINRISKYLIKLPQLLSYSVPSIDKTFHNNLCFCWPFLNLFLNK